MNEFLARMYGTGQVKEASEMNNTDELLDAFCKQAAAEDINLNQLSDAQVEQLFGVYVSKIAEEEKKDDDKDEEEKKAYAYAEFAQMKEAQAKMAEADFIGRQIAHACVDELRKIASDDGEKVAGEPGRTVAAVGKKLKSLGSDLASGAKDATKGVRKQVSDGADDLGRSTRKSVGAEDFGDKARAAYNKAKDWAGSHKRELAIGGGTAAAGAAAGALAARRDKKSSAFDEEAAIYGLKLAHVNGFNAEAVGERLDALFTLGAQSDIENSKVASAQSYEQGLHLRGLELLEQIGIPIDWNSLCGA